MSASLSEREACGQIEVEHEIELEGLADLGLVLHHAMIGVQRQPAHEHLVGHWA